MPIERSSMQFKLWILLLIISAILVFIALKAFESKIDDSLVQPGSETDNQDYSGDYLSIESNETLEEGLFNQFETQKSVFYIALTVIPFLFVIGFVVKFIQDRKKEK